MKWDPSNSRDNAAAGLSGRQLIDAYKIDGTRLWRIDLGRNIRAGAHYTQFMVYDLDGDGRARSRGIADSNTREPLNDDGREAASSRRLTGRVSTGM